MSSILKEFYRGDLSPADRQMVRNSELGLLTEETAKLMKLLFPGQYANQR